jgi:glutamine amidotransferase
MTRQEPAPLPAPLSGGRPGPLSGGRRLRVAVVDYGAANMVSITKALAAAGADVVVAADASGFAGADALVVPGVGAAASAMVQLEAQGLRQPICDWVRAGKPYLGICLGFQLLFESSDEGDAEALGLLKGRVSPLQDAPTLPHIGWNAVEFERAHPLFDGIVDGSYFYFVHSYAAVPTDGRIVVARTTHGRSFVSAVASGCLFGVQFHPEKSAEAGLRVLANFLRLAAEASSPSAVAGGSADHSFEVA